MNRKAMVLSALMTAFVLVVIGGLVARVTAAPAAAAAQAVSRAAAEVVTAGDSPAASAPAASDDIGEREAARLALRAAPGAKLLRWPELVDLQGQPAYEVVLDQGTMYIDAATGVVLFDGRPAPSTGTVLGGEQHDDHEQHEAQEHEFGDDD